jgi:hypothetical protein
MIRLSNQVNTSGMRLNCNYRFSFKNKYFHYHNGGLWPMITGFFAAACVKADRPDYAEKYLDGINRSNKKDKKKNGNSVNISTQTLRPHGTKFQGGRLVEQSSLKKHSKEKRYLLYKDPIFHLTHIHHDHFTISPCLRHGRHASAEQQSSL